jgi:hypothetical protein
VHVSLVDVTELAALAKELNAQTFQKGAYPMVMVDDTVSTCHVIGDHSYI